MTRNDVIARLRLLAGVAADYLNEIEQNGADLSSTIHYDAADCDGFCLIEDLRSIAETYDDQTAAETAIKRTKWEPYFYAGKWFVKRETFQIIGDNAQSLHLEVDQMWKGKLIEHLDLGEAKSRAEWLNSREPLTDGNDPVTDAAISGIVAGAN